MEIQEIDLKRIPITSRIVMNRSLLESAPDVELLVRDEVDRRIIDLYTYVYGEEFEPVVISYPADWREAFKERWFPTWAKRRWPVRYTMHRIEAKAWYPKLSLKSEQAVIRLKAWTNEEVRQ